MLGALSYQRGDAIDWLSVEATGDKILLVKPSPVDLPTAARGRAEMV